MMNNQSLSWIDRGRWAGLLAKATEVLAPAPYPASAWPPLRPPASGVGSVRRPRARRPTPPLPGVPIPPATPRLPGVPAPPGSRAFPDRSPLPGAPPASPGAAAGYPPFTSPSRSLEERLQALVGWIEACVPCHAAFIADDNGLPVVEHLGAEPGQIAAASSILLMLASVRSLMQGSGGWLSLKLGETILHVVEVATPWGRFGIGVVTDDCLPREFLTALSSAVERAFHGEPAEGGST
jgi:hypothetical protein